FFFSSRRRHTRFSRDWSSDVCSSDLSEAQGSGGPDLTHVASRYSLGLGRTGRLTVGDFEAWITSKEHLLQPHPKMPAYDDLVPEELRSIALYLESLQ